jgi:hypothetical protein
MEGTKKPTTLLAAAALLLALPFASCSGDGGGEGGRVVNVTGVALSPNTLELAVG